MRIILLEDVENVGKKFEVKEFKDGFARNFLIAKGLGKLATDDALKWLDMQKELKEVKEEEDLKNVQKKASSLEDQEIVIQVKVGEEGQLFEAINAQKISEKLKESGFDIKKSQVILDEPIKEVGEFSIKIKLEHNLEAEIRIIVTKEEEK